MRKLTAVAGAEDAGRRVKYFVRGDMGVSCGQFAALKQRGGLLVNGQPVHANHALCPGDTVTVLLEDAARESAAPEEGPVNVVYEDEDENGRSRRQNGDMSLIIQPDAGQDFPAMTLTAALTARSGLQTDQSAHWNLELDWQELGGGANKLLDKGGRLLCMTLALDAVGSRLKVYTGARRRGELQMLLLRAALPQTLLPRILLFFQPAQSPPLQGLWISTLLPLLLILQGFPLPRLHRPLRQPACRRAWPGAAAVHASGSPAPERPPLCPPCPPPEGATPRYPPRPPGYP